MTEIIAGIAIPDSAIATDAARQVSEITSPLLFHHSRRTFLFAALHARRLDVEVDLDLLYIAALFHDVGLESPFGGRVQRFEVDGADHARAFLRSHGTPEAAADTVWAAIALHTTPGIPERMSPEVALTHAGVLTDVIGVGLESVPPEARAEIVAAHPRDDFAVGFLHALHEGVKDRPDTTYGTVNADVLEHFEPGYPRIDLVDRVMGSAWAGDDA